MKDDTKEKPNLLSLKVPNFMDGNDYWELFEDMQFNEGFILLGIFTSSFNINE